MLRRQSKPQDHSQTPQTSPQNFPQRTCPRPPSHLQKKLMDPSGPSHRCARARYACSTPELIKLSRSAPPRRLCSAIGVYPGVFSLGAGTCNVRKDGGGVTPTSKATPLQIFPRFPRPPSLSLSFLGTVRERGVGEGGVDPWGDGKSALGCGCRGGDLPAPSSKIMFILLGKVSKV